MAKPTDSTESGPEENQMGDRVGAKEKKKVRLDDQILAILKTRGELQFGEIAKLTKMEDKTSNLSYHLTRLKDKGLIDKEVRRPLRKTFWKYTAPAPSIIESEIIKLLESDYQTHSIDDIKVSIGRMSHPSDPPSPDEIEETLRSLDKSGRIEEVSMTSDNLHYNIPFS